MHVSSVRVQLASRNRACHRWAVQSAAHPPPQPPRRSTHHRSPHVQGWAAHGGDRDNEAVKRATGVFAGDPEAQVSLLHLPRMSGHGEQPRVKNGPALAGHGAESVRDAIAASIRTLPE
jgi:hypothetical protein